MKQDMTNWSLLKEHFKKKIILMSLLKEQFLWRQVCFKENIYRKHRNYTFFYLNPWSWCTSVPQSFNISNEYQKPCFNGSEGGITSGWSNKYEYENPAFYIAWFLRMKKKILCSRWSQCLETLLKLKIKRWVDHCLILTCSYQGITTPLLVQDMTFWSVLKEHFLYQIH